MLRLLSAAEALECLRTATAFQERLSLPDGIAYLSETLAEYGALCAFCLFREGEKAFESPEEALRTLTLDELCDVYDSYCLLNGDEENG